MKKLILLLIFAMLLFTACAKKEVPPVEEKPVEVPKVTSMNFIVQGEGEIAKKLIEGAVHSVKGVTEVNWDMDKKTIKISGTDELVWEDVHSAIAAAGFDTSVMNATDEAYDALPEEAKYRKEITEKKATLRENGKEPKTKSGRIKTKRKKA